MPHLHRTKLQIEADRRGEESTRRLGAELGRFREDAGLTKAAVARAAGIDPTYLLQIEAGRRDASAQVLARIAAVLGAEVSTRLFPMSGPRIRDRFQAPMIEAFLRLLPPRWRQAVEVAVHRPVRGVIDAVVSDATDPDAVRIVTIEAQSELRRIEQQIRWAAAKSDALPSSDLWPVLARGPNSPPTVSRILLLRSTATTRELARAHASTLAAAYPADPAALLRAIAGPTEPAAPWPGSGIIWVNLHGRTASILPGRPRGVPAS